MSNTNRNNVITGSGLEKNEIRGSNIDGNISTRPQQPDNSTLIRRTLVEHGIRPVGESNTANNHVSTAAVITARTKQREDEQRELQDLNAKFAVYLDRVQYLEDYNQRLDTDLRDLKEAWGGDTTQLEAAYDPQLQGLRFELDKVIRDQALQELQLKRHDYDIWQIQEQLATMDADYDAYHLNLLKQELEASSIELDQLRHQFDETFSELERIKNLTESLFREVNGLKNELDNHQLERIMIGNELQTLREHVAFQTSVHQAQRDELLSLNTPALDVSSFYRAELTRAISDIRRDFEILLQSQTNELEAYYKIKTEQVREEIETENERKRLLANEGAIELMDPVVLSSTLKDNHNDLISLQTENKTLQTELDAIINDLETIQDEHLREKESHDREIALIREELADKRETINNILENNVSLRFEMSTYRGLLQAEEQHLNRVEQEPLSQSLSTSSYDSQQTPSSGARSNATTKKMNVQKTARGPISFDSIDLETDSVILVNEKYSGSEQPLRNWSIHRQIDEKPEIIYQFPSTFSLQPRQKIHIFSKKSSNSASVLNDSLVADKIDTWGIGQQMVTRLIDNNNEEKAIITQIFQ